MAAPSATPNWPARPIATAGACRRSASRPGDTVAGLLPNGAAALALYFAAIETGLYVVPVNWHQVAAEVAYILGDSGAGAFVAHERFAGTAVAAADLAGIKHRFAVGSVPGFDPLARLGDDGSADRPAPRTHGAPMLYTSGTSGRPKGVRRPLTGADPDDAARHGRLVLQPVQPGPVRRPRAPVRLPALPHGRAQLRHASRSSSAIRWC